MTFEEFHEEYLRNRGPLGTSTIAAIADVMELHEPLGEAIGRRLPTTLGEDLWHVLPDKYKEMDLDTFLMLLTMKGVEP